MTAAAANRNAPYTVDGPYEDALVKASDIIYALTLVGFNAAGYLEPYSTSTSVKFAGVAMEYVDNSTGANGAKRCKVAKGGKFTFVKSGTITIANVGDELQGVDDQTAALGFAALTINPAGSNNSMTYTSKLQGLEGEQITVEYVDPGGASASLNVDVQGTGIKVNLATGTDSAITSTAALVKAAIEANAAAAALVSVADAGGDDGTGVVAAAAEAALATAPSIGQLVEVDGSNVLVRINAAAAA